MEEEGEECERQHARVAVGVGIGPRACGRKQE